MLNFSSRTCLSLSCPLLQYAIYMRQSDKFVDFLRQNAINSLL